MLACCCHFARFLTREQDCKPIQVAAHIGDLPLVRCLVEEFGADPVMDGHRGKPRHLHGQTALCIALEHGHVSVVAFMIRAFPGKIQQVCHLMLCALLGCFLPIQTVSTVFGLNPMRCRKPFFPFSAPLCPVQSPVFNCRLCSCWWRHLDGM